jgi:hypothetical protein
MWALSSLLYLAPLLVLQGKTSLSAFAPEQLQALALMLLKLNAQAYDIGLVFFGFWCVLIGYLILRSTFLPRIIAVLEVLASLGYLTLLWRPLAHYLLSLQPRARRPRGNIAVAVAPRERGERSQVERNRRRWAERLSANWSLPRLEQKQATDAISSRANHCAS